MIVLSKLNSYMLFKLKRTIYYFILIKNNNNFIKMNMKDKKILPKRKILPGLGGIKKNYLDKAHILEKTLVFLGDKLDDLIFCHYSKKIKMIEKLKIDMKRLSKYKNKRKLEYYLICQEIINSY